MVSQGGPGASAGTPAGDVEGAVKSPMQGNMWKIKVAEGDSVAAGQVLAILEVMKMEQDVKAEKDGQVKKIFIKEGDPVKKGESIMQIL